MSRQYRLQVRAQTRRRRKVLFIVAAIVGLLFVINSSPSHLSAARQSSASAAKFTRGVPPARAISKSLADPAARPTPEFAVVAGTDVHLHLPADPAEVRAVGYHQAFNPKAYPLQPRGQYLEGETIKDQVARSVASGRAQAFVMYSRGRRSVATSSVDVVMPVGPPVLSPVTGQVKAVVPYRLYGRMDDVRVEIVPDGHPEMVVALVHITDIKVAPGQRVEAGMSPLAVLRPLGIRSQIDEYTGLVEQHVHIQVNPPAPEPVAPQPRLAPGRR